MRIPKVPPIRRALPGVAPGAAASTRVLPETNACFRSLFIDNPQPMWVCDLKTLQFLEVNNAAVEHYGYSREEFLRMLLTDIRQTDIRRTEVRPAEDVPRLPDTAAAG